MRWTLTASLALHLLALVALAAQGRDIRMSDDRVEGYRNFMNKLWNAARYVLGARPPEASGERPDAASVRSAAGEFGAWFASRIDAAVEDVDRNLAGFGFSEAAQRIYDAIWAEYCDQAIELAKVTLADASRPAAERVAVWWTLVDGLDTLLRLLHPIAPFITEGIWEVLPRGGGEVADIGGAAALVVDDGDLVALGGEAQMLIDTGATLVSQVPSPTPPHTGWPSSSTHHAGMRLPNTGLRWCSERSAAG